jgi:menaquinone-specific isochorismate synthase
LELIVGIDCCFLDADFRLAIMPVSPHQYHQLPTADSLATLLTECYLSFLQNKHSRIVSIAFDIDQFSPLALLQQCHIHYHNHFYFERGEHCCIAVGKAIQVTVESRDRFAQTRELIGDLTSQIWRVDACDRAAPPNRFFCNFSFFSQDQSAANQAAQAAILLPRWQIEQAHQQAHAIVNLALHPDFIPELEASKVWRELCLIQAPHSPLVRPSATDEYSTDYTTHQSAAGNYERSVTQALQSIAAGQLDKIVLAEALDIVASQDFNLIASLANLRDRYQNCYIFSATCGTDQTFIGASPERLVAVHDRQMQTAALAGSAPRGNNPAEDLQFAQALLSSTKEAHEHQLVIDFIVQRLVALDIQPQLEPARLMQLPNIQHRHTPIQAQLPPTVHLLDVVAALHPTPAVAGIPREIACQHIQHYESGDRGWYAAPIGWVDTAGNGEFAVGIRSAMLKGNTARLFAGAGIVAGSDPARERQEVNLKLKALLKALV